MIKKLLTPTEASEYLGVSKKTLYNWVYKKKIPYVKISRKCLKFDLEKLNKWIEEMEIKPIKFENFLK